MIGTTLAHYRITGELGAGGMGEVWRAEDTKLDREVALKVLPADVAGDEERLARFEREAKVLASLNHPNIAHLYGLETVASGMDADADSDAGSNPQTPKPSSPTTFLVMELVEGEDLSERISRGPISTDEAIPIALQIAEALEAAHESGIVHRDLKPANIKLTEDGSVKVLDFGLAKAWETDHGDSSLSLSPTLTQHATMEGVILGTAAYMSPEQARGKKVDRRADIWAFGVVLWEMLTGRKLFEGETVSDVMAAVLTFEPDPDSLPPETPSRIRTLLDRCLRRDPRSRQRDMGDVRLDLADAADHADEPNAAVLTRSAGNRWVVGVMGIVAGLAIGAALYFVYAGSIPSTDAAPHATRRSILLTEPLGGPRQIMGLAISPGGNLVALGQDYGGDGLLELRRLNSFESTLVPGTEGAIFPFFSPDGEWLAYFDGDELRKMPVGGGLSTVICVAQTSMGGTWSDDGWIYFTHGESRLARVSASGGEPEDLNDQIVFGPSALPGGRGVLAALSLVGTSSSRKEAATISLVKGDGSFTTLIEGGYAPKYAASGHLVFVRQGALFAAPFDLERLEVTGPEAQVVEGVLTDSIWADAVYDIASDGTLVYVRGGDYAETVPTWITRDGREEPLPIPRNVYGTFQLSPDRSRLAIQLSEAQDQIYVFDFSRRAFTRLTFEGPSRYPAWSHDGRELIYHAFRDGEITLMRRPVDGSGGEQPILSESQRRLIGARVLDPYSVSPDGRHLLVTTWGDLEMGADVWLLTLDGSADPRPLLRTPDNEIIPMFSPNGEYISYLSNKAGPYGIYVRPFPDVERREWTISARGGFDARWSPAGDEILYRVGGMKVMSVPFELEPEFNPGAERLVLETDFHDSAGYSFDLSTDGERILVNRPSMSFHDHHPVLLVTDWFVELQQLVDRGGVR